MIYRKTDDPFVFSSIIWTVNSGFVHLTNKRDVKETASCKRENTRPTLLHNCRRLSVNARVYFSESTNEKTKLHKMALQPRNRFQTIKYHRRTTVFETAAFYIRCIIVQLCRLELDFDDIFELTFYGNKT